jgi:dsDNA-specific endonuclease/ATPase MutS2
MDDRSLRALDFYSLLEILEDFSTSPLGRKRCEALRPSKDLPFIESRLTEVLELKEILETVGDLPIRGLKEIEGILRRLEVEDSVLTVQEIMDVYNQIVLYDGVKRFFNKLEKVKALHLQERVSKIFSWKETSGHVSDGRPGWPHDHGLGKTSFGRTALLYLRWCLS